MKVRSLIIKHASAGLEVFSRHQGYMWVLSKLAYHGLQWLWALVFLMIFVFCVVFTSGWQRGDSPSWATEGVLQLTVIRRSVLGMSTISHICTRRNV